MSQIVAETVTERRYLLSSVIAPPHLDIIHIIDHPSQFQKDWRFHFRTSPIVALDFETKGNDFSHPDFEIVGVGLSTGTLSVYTNLSTCSAQEKKEFLLPFGRLPLIGHNVYFDGGCYYRTTGFHANWQYCTYGLYKQLSSESNELRWGLKEAQKELLGWEETNEVELDEWLVTNGYHKQNKAPKKAEMWRAPITILGKYCALDAQSTWQLFTKVLEPALKRYSPLILPKYHQEDFLTEVEFLIEQQIEGITVDELRCKVHASYLEDKIAEVKNRFLCHPEVALGISQYNQSYLQAIADAEPTKFKKRPALGNEPSRLTKAGAPSKVWEKWNEKKERIEAWEENEENIAAPWKAWKAKYEETKLVPHFNIQSGEQLKWLYYEYLKYPVLLRTENDQPSIEENALKHFGESGQLLIEYNTLVKEQGYVLACLEHLRNGRIHPQFKIPGTLTGRLAGAGGLNLQQLPKSAGYLACWRPTNPDKIWVDFDIIGAEAVVATELSRDPAMLSIYGPTAPKNDIYLYFGSFIPGIGEEIRAAGYHPENPTKEGLESAKKKCKGLRQICKTVVLAKQYGAGANKIHKTLQLQGVNLSFQEVKDISDSYDRTFRVLREFGRKLKDQWRTNKGYVLNGIGRPITVSDRYLKDLTNRVVQSTGHDIHMKCIRIFRDVMKTHKLSFKWVICDFHDQAIIECSKSDAERIKELISTEVVDKLNEELQGLIPIKYDPQIVRSLSEAKVEGYKEAEKKEESG